MPPGNQSSIRLLYVGQDPGLRERLSKELAAEVLSAAPTLPQAGDLVLLDTRAPDPALRGGNAFSACRAWRQDLGVRVIALVDADDVHAGPIATFCGAEASLRVRAGAIEGDLASLRAAVTGTGRRSKVDDLLAHYERKLEQDPTKKQLGMRRIVASDASSALMAQLSDPETGLWDGAFASYKIDEELKRAIRMRQPLTLILLDLGVSEDMLATEARTRRLLLAEVAAVFLNESRDIDVLSRFTPTVFLFLLPGTGHEGGGVVARRMIDGLRTRSPIAGIALDPRAGLVTVPAPGVEHREAFLMRAEACLARARAAVGGSGVSSALE